MAKQISIKTLAVLFSIIIVSAASFFALEKTGTIDLWHKNIGPSDSDLTKQKQEEAEKQFNSDNKRKFIEGTQSSDNNTKMNDGDHPDISITAQKEANDTVTVFTKLTGISSGQCQLTISNGAITTSQAVDVIYQPEFSTCAGFSIPVSRLGSGMWHIRLSVDSNGKSQEKTITFEVK